LLEGGIAQDATILSTIPLGSFAGISLTVLPWLLSGGTLSLHHAFDPVTFAAQCRAQDGGAVVLPGPALGALAQAGCLDDPKNIFALWRSPERLASSASWHGEAALVDIASFGEVGLLALRRGADGMPSPVPRRHRRGAARRRRRAQRGRDDAQRSRHAGFARTHGAGACLSARRRAR
jgi:hypothetical protein